MKYISELNGASSVSIVTQVTYPTTGESVSGSFGGMLLFATSSTVATRCTQPLDQRVQGVSFLGVKRPGPEAVRLPVSSDSSNAWSYTSFTPYVFMSSYLGSETAFAF